MNSAYLSTLPRGLTLQKASLFTSDSEQPPGSPHLQSRVGLTFYVNEPTTLQCRPSPWSARQRNGSWSPDNVTQRRGKQYIRNLQSATNAFCGQSIPPVWLKTKNIAINCEFMTY